MKKLLAILTVLVVGLGIASFFQPTEYTIEQKATIAAPIDNVFTQVVDHRNWKLWSPWFERDNSMEITYSDISSGQGATSSWVSKTEGEGKSTFTSVTPNKEIQIKLDFFKPWEGQAKSQFNFEQSGENSTSVTWTMIGKNNSFTEKFFYLVFAFNKEIAKDLGKGLSNLKNNTEPQ